MAGECNLINHRKASIWVLKQKMMLSEASYKIVQPLVFTSRVFAVCPVSFTKIGTCYQLKYSPFLVLYSYAFVVASGIGTILGVKIDMGEGVNAVRMKNDKNKYISICDIFIVLMIALYVIVSIPYKMRQFVKMLDIWSQVDNLIPIANHQKYRRNSIWLLSITLLMTILLFVFDIFIYCLQWRVSNDPTYYIQVYIGYYMLYFILIFQEVFFWHVVFFIHIRLFTLNENLSKIKINFNRGMKKLFVVPYNTVNMNNSTDNLAEIKSRISGKNQLNNDTKFGKNTADRIQELLRVYGKLRESVEILNGSASYGVALIMLSCLLHLVVTPYFLLLEMFKSNSSMVFILLQTVWLLAHIGRLLIIVEPCQRCINELKDFAAIFSFADINFHACGFFNINRNLLTSVAGAVSTYLVILFQFDGKAGK